MDDRSLKNEIRNLVDGQAAAEAAGGPGSAGPELEFEK